jgi:hypothetical protein
VKRCKSCGLSVDQWPMQPRNGLAVACSIPCAQKLAQEKQRKEQERQNRARVRRIKQGIRADRERMKTLPQLKKEAQKAFNAYIRERDKLKPCISCDKPADSQPNGWDCSHYRSVGAAPHLRFDEANAHKSCKWCNQHASGNIVEYRLRLPERIGHAELERIETDNEVKRYTKEDLREITRLYRAKLKALALAQKPI